METRSAMTPKMLLDFIRISTDSVAACSDDLTMNLILADSGERFFLKRSSGVMLIFKGETKENAECTVTLAKRQLMGLTFGK